MANLQNYFQEIVTCTATLKFRVQIIQKVGSSTEIKVRYKVGEPFSMTKSMLRHAARNAVGMP